MKLNEYIESLFWIKGKTIAIVYNYQGDSKGGASKYDFWEGDVIADWIHAVYELHGMPFIIDARTFIEKAMQNSLPPIDYVVDLNDGFYDLSSLALVPATCAYCNIPCIPCDASLLLMGENKILSNIVAESLGFEIPMILDEESEKSITRPFCFGSSCGVIKGKSEIKKVKTIVQEFIPGFDVTIPLIYCPTQEDLIVTPAVAYCHEKHDPQWFLGEQQKKSHKEYTKQIIQIDDVTKNMVKKFANYIGVKTYCRFDFRCIAETPENIIYHMKNGITWDKLKFIEINTLPTIKENVNFLTSLNEIEKESPIFECIDKYFKTSREATLTGFVLSSSIISLIRAMH